MMECLSEQRVAIYAVLHDTAVTKDDHKHLDLKDNQLSNYSNPLEW